MELAPINHLKCIFSPLMSRFLLIPFFFLTVHLASQDTVHHTSNAIAEKAIGLNQSTSASRPAHLPIAQIQEPEIPHPNRALSFELSAVNSELFSFHSPQFSPGLRALRPCPMISKPDRWLVFRQIRV
jgi:hypothetical protein